MTQFFPEEAHRDAQIKYAKGETHWQARGRNNYMQCHGIALSPFLLDTDRPEIWLNPITSKGFSETCRIPVPQEALSELIATLARYLPDGELSKTVRGVTAAYAETANG